MRKLSKHWICSLLYLLYVKFMSSSTAAFNCSLLDIDFTLEKRIWPYGRPLLIFYIHVKCLKMVHLRQLFLFYENIFLLKCLQNSFFSCHYYMKYWFLWPTVEEYIIISWSTYRLGQRLWQWPLQYALFTFYF